MSLSVDPRAKALIFDLDGTLIQSVPLHYTAWKQVIAEEGQHFGKEDFSRINGSTSTAFAQKVIKDYALDADAGLLVSRKNERYLSMLDQLRVYEAVVAVARETSLPCAVGTNELREIAERSMKATSLDRIFDILVSSEDVPQPKPAPDVFLRCAELLQVDAAHCMVFEDSALGVEAARQAGMMVCNVTDSVGT